jgi:hypothetical protein
MATLQSRAVNKLRCFIVFSAVPAMDFDSLYSDYNFDDQDFYAAVSPHNNDSRNKMVSLKLLFVISNISLNNSFVSSNRC